jgi:purine nucleosidase
VIFVLLAMSILAPQLGARTIRVVVDTDAGSDDLMAIAFLLARPDVEIEAINVVHGLAHVPRGVENIRKLLIVAGRDRIPVHPGATKPLKKAPAFPAAWRTKSDRLLQDLPAPPKPPSGEDAVAWYRNRTFRDTTVLALGPLTNLALAIGKGAAFSEIVIMGGAVDVPGNLGDGGFFKTNNKKAEWNIFCDPAAADIVFKSGAHIRMVPLDATNRVPLDLGFLDHLQKGAVSPAARAVAHLLEPERELIQQGFFFAWDPLAAVGLVDPKVLRMVSMNLTVDADGSIRRDDKGSRVDVAMDADAALFRGLYLETLH